MRKLVRETKWRVSLTSAQGPIEKVIDAPTQDVAVSRAMRAFPGQQFTTMSVTQIDTQTNIPTAQASAQNPLPAQMQPLQPIRQLASPAQILQAKQQQVAREAVDPNALAYPYSVTLPAQFRRVLEQTAPVEMLEQNGQYYVILENHREMKSFLDKLNNHNDRKTATMIVSGIRSSIS